MKSKKGQEFEVGVKKKASETGTAKADAESTTTSTDDSYADVSWAPDDERHNLTPSVLGIYSYVVGLSSVPFYQYYIQFNTDLTGLYYFHDESFDSYQIRVLETTAEHIIRYSSDMPTIVQVHLAS